MANSTTSTQGSGGGNTAPSGSTGLSSQVQAGGAMSSLAGGLPILTPGYLTSHRVGIQGQKDVIWNPIYDRNLYPGAGVTTQALNFYSQQQGAGISVSPGAYWGAAGKTVYDTNLQAPNAFTLGQEFYCIGLETAFTPGVPAAITDAWDWKYLIGRNATTYFGATAGEGAPSDLGAFANDVWGLSQTGYVSLKIGTDRFYVQDGPLMKFPPRTRLAISSAVAGAFEAAGAADTPDAAEITYAQPSGVPYLIVPIYFQTNQLFTLTISFAGTIATPSSLGVILTQVLNGYLIRQAT